ncbi:hypothetical protein N7471_008682 [Penicillium samsonianum]|uniref:uncharacterized protein n=1 Tax=Penicillium samsonianum TaxID=1882272 RepID=UPI002549BA58|nr:uncharacterized protein N7471_008682 [Penicillium samsonianum]KAJ6133467.1 hypothetical protein N7471_008682 [Penicillium samsonianum]
MLLHAPKHDVPYTPDSSEAHPFPSIPRLEPLIEHNPGKEKVASPSDDQLELLTQLRVCWDELGCARERVFQEACGTMQSVQIIIRQYAHNGQSPDVHVLWTLEGRMQSLITVMFSLQAAEEGAYLAILRS